MSKMDAQRAMREAKWARTQARAAESATPPRSTRPRPPVAPPVDRAAPYSAPDSPPDTAASSAPVEALCGHASMNGRTCTRPAGHPQKSHRYS